VYFVSAERKKEEPAAEALYRLAPWTYLSTVLEHVVVSEVPGAFTMRTTRPICDVTGLHVLIPQGQRVGGEVTTASLLLGNERMPAYAVSVAMPDGSTVDLGEAQITDATGANGLTGEVDNHTWRLVWTSIFIEGLQAGQQMLQQGIANQSEGTTITGVGQHSSNVAKQRLGRAQDTRPTITTKAGDLAFVRVPGGQSLPSYGACDNRG
jgi:type IV secretion system protein VirB10